MPYLQNSKEHFKPIGENVFQRYPKETKTTDILDASLLVETFIWQMKLAKG